MVTMPPLPDENDDPWFEKRRNFDLATKTALEGYLDQSNLNTVYSSFLSKNIVANKGDLLVAYTSGTVDRLPVGDMEQVLVADPTMTLGMRWSNRLSQAVSDAQEAINKATEALLSGIVSVVVEYAVNDSEIDPPEEGWSTDTPERVPGTYIWSRTTTTYGDETASTSSPVLITGNTGATGSGEPGPPGVGIDSIVVTYQAHTNGATAPTGAWLSSVPAVPPGQFLWSRTVITYTDETTITGYSVALQGQTGSPGDPGEDGKGIASSIVHYQVSASGTTVPTGTWATSVPAVPAGQFLWTRTVITFTDDTTQISYSTSRHGQDGSQGIQGPPGSEGLSRYTWLKYADSPTTGMSDSPEGKTYMGVAYNKTIATESSNYADYEWSLIRGAEGKGISSTAVTYQVHSNGTTAPIGEWLSSVPATSAGQFLWTRTITTYTDDTNSTAYSVAVHGATGSAGATGKGISSTSVTYQVHSNGTTAPTGTWVSSPPATSPGEFLWTRTVITYTDAETTTVYAVAAHGAQGSQGIQGPPGPNGQPTYTWIKYGTSAAGAGMSDDPAGKTYIGIAYNKTTATESSNPADYAWSLIQGPQGSTGPAGKGVASSAVTYQAHSNGTTAPTGTWVDTPPATTPGQFLWTRTVITYTDATTTTAYMVAKHGETGSTGSTGPAGKGVSSTSVTYQAHSNGTSAPTGTWGSSPPETTPGQFLWTRTITTYTDATTTTAYSVAAHGPTGVGISSTAVTYQVHSNGTTAPTGTWVSSPPATTPGQFLWTRTITTYTDTSSITAYSVSAHGATGSTGAAGKGISGTVVTYQVHSNGTTAPTGTWLSAPPATTPGQFLWTRTVTTYTDATTTTAYSVAVHGATGSTGAAGKGISSTAVTYQVHSNGTTAPTGTWVGSPAATSPGQFLWTRTITTYTDATTTTSYSVAAHGATGSTGSPGVSVSSITSYYLQVAEGSGIPAKPINNPPGGSWSLTEPGYTTSTELYRAELVVFSNATFAWSEVSKVSSYVAASQAVVAANLADAAAKGTVKASIGDPGHQVGRIWLVLDEEGNTIGIKISDGSSWASYALMADQILVPGSVGPVQISNGAITAVKLDVEGIWADEAWLTVLRAGVIEVDMLMPNVGDTLTISVKSSVEALSSQIDAQIDILTEQTQDITTLKTDLDIIGEGLNTLEGTANTAKTLAEGVNTNFNALDQEFRDLNQVYNFTSEGAFISSEGSEFEFVISNTGARITRNEVIQSEWKEGKFFVDAIKLPDNPGVNIEFPKHKIERYDDGTIVGTIVRAL